MNAFRAWSAPLLLTLALAACSSGPGRLEPARRTVLKVDNRSTLDMAIYVLPEAGVRRRLGQATALMISTFTIPSSLLFGPTEMRFQADPIGGTRAPVTESITIVPGDTVVMRIPLSEVEGRAVAAGPSARDYP